MGKVLYFSGTDALTAVSSISNSKFEALFPGVAGVKSDGYSKRVGYDDAGNLRPMTRVIFRKSNPSNHKCDARCRHAKGGNCECSCGGKFHGAG